MSYSPLELTLAGLPLKRSFHYYTDRASAWLLAHLWREEAGRVSDLRQESFGKLIDRPILKPLVAGSGGRLQRGDVLALAFADRHDAFPPGHAALQSALDAVWAEAWHDFELTFCTWGTGRTWEEAQISRQGGSLVIQLGFPSDHAQLMGRHLPTNARAKFQDAWHPVRISGRPSLAWARVDVDTQRGEALIEEIQGDWLRLVAEEVAWLADAQPQNRETRAHQSYKKALFHRYAKLWPQAMLLATLSVLVELLGVRRVWMHQPAAGAVLKGIRGVCPPVSLYSKLPKSFCFQPSFDVPGLLLEPSPRKPRFARTRLKDVKAMAEAGTPIFWRLDVSA